MTTLFYRRAPVPPPGEEPLPRGCTLRFWTPDRLPPRLNAENLAWFGLARARVFARPGFVEITLWRDRTLLHRLIVTPRWYRFPFMARDDLQVGALWTCPAARGHGFAGIAIAAAHRYLGADVPPLWYVTDAANTASIRLAERNGYTHVANGRRTAPLGIRALGRYIIDAPR